MAECNEPESIEKALLAEDIVNYFIHGKLTRKDASKYENCAECFKELIFNGLYEAIQKVFESLNDSRDHVINEDFKHLKSRKKLDKESFVEYAMSFRRVLLWEDFEPMCFLRYCLYVSGMAGMFHKNGVNDAPNMAVEMIKIGFPEGCLPDEFWEIFHKAVTKYVSEECPATGTKSEECPATGTKSEECPATGTKSEECPATGTKSEECPATGTKSEECPATGTKSEASASLPRDDE